MIGIKKLKNNQAGFSLLEMVVAIAIFSVMIISASQIFLSVLSAQRASLASQNVQEALFYAFETMSKELRDAKIDSSCSSDVYELDIDEDAIYFANKSGECIEYYWQSSDHKIYRKKNSETAWPLTPLNITVEDFNFYLSDSKQPKITFSAEAFAVGKEVEINNFYLQTTVSSRYYE